MSWLAVAAVSAAVSGAIVLLLRFLPGSAAVHLLRCTPTTANVPETPEFVQPPRPQTPSLGVGVSDADAATVHVLRPRRREMVKPEPPTCPNAA